LVVRGLVLIAALLVVGMTSPSRAAERLSTAEYKSGPQIRVLLRELVESVRNSTAAVVCDGKTCVMGTIVDSSGLVLTKASELNDDVRCRLSDGREFDAEIVARNEEFDLAMLQITAKNLTAANLNSEHVPVVGQWLATVGLQEEPIALGVVSVPPRNIARGRPLLGVQLGDLEEPRGALIESVMPDSAAERAKLKAGDVVTRVNDRKVTSRPEMIEIIGEHITGETIRMHILRDEKEMDLEATLGSFNLMLSADPTAMMSRGVSKRRDGFPMALQHDTVLRPKECGGPLINLRGELVGINIARAERTASYALPIHTVKQVIQQMMATVANQEQQPAGQTAEEDADAKPAPVSLKDSDDNDDAGSESESE
jgi:serine protease Do